MIIGLANFLLSSTRAPRSGATWALAMTGLMWPRGFQLVKVGPLGAEQYLL